MLSLLSFTKAFVVSSGGLRKKTSITPRPESDGLEQVHVSGLKARKWEGEQKKGKSILHTNV